MADLHAIAAVGDDLPQAIALAEAHPPGTLGFSSAWARAERAADRVGELADALAPAAPIVRAALATLPASPRISHPSDAAEVEAERAADAVMAGASRVTLTQTGGGQVQRQSAADVARWGLMAAGALAADDVTGIGAADDVLIPVALGIAGIAGLIALATSSSSTTTTTTTTATTARRYPNQTCEDSVLDALQATMHGIGDRISGESCSPSKVSPKRLARRPCSEIRARIAALAACLAARNRIQNECFGGNPDPRHADAIAQETSGLTACLALQAVNCAPGHPMADL
ncbi:hypothetical protein WME97_45360 [Sorangium sp. So ce367]|uniref:hypothetical protein n=1 Tax=Sorangium sp. So ce367 TaxID=3133305 RepID=UPI003F615EA5